MLTFNVFLDKKKTASEAQNTGHQYHLTTQKRPHIVSSPTISKNTVNPNTRNTVWLFNYTASYLEVTTADFNETALKIHLRFQVRNYIFLHSHSICQNPKPFEALRNYHDFHDECY